MNLSKYAFNIFNNVTLLFCKKNYVNMSNTFPGISSSSCKKGIRCSNTVHFLVRCSSCYTCYLIMATLALLVPHYIVSMVNIHDQIFIFTKWKNTFWLSYFIFYIMDVLVCFWQLLTFDVEFSQNRNYSLFHTEIHIFLF
jgi:hypothetical protein